MVPRTEGAAVGLGAARLAPGPAGPDCHPLLRGQWWERLSEGMPAVSEAALHAVRALRFFLESSLENFFFHGVVVGEGEI